MPKAYETLAMSDAQVIAALGALPARFRFEVGRVTRSEPDPFLANAVMPADAPEEKRHKIAEEHERALMASICDRIAWTVMIATGEYGEPSFSARGATLAEAYSRVRHQIAAFAEVLANA